MGFLGVFHLGYLGVFDPPHRWSQYNEILETIRAGQFLSVSGRDFTYSGEKVFFPFHQIAITSPFSSPQQICIAILAKTSSPHVLQKKGLPVWDKHSLDQLWLRLWQQRLG